ncbi:helix-turn-helix domain-containing protein [Bacillus sp. PS06]|nr:helix-turn-helix domain-containing protein [Bacillus sp. PS06]
MLLKSYSVKEVASVLSMNEETVRRWIRDEKLKAENIGGRVGYRISEDDLKRFILEEKGTKTFTEEMAANMDSMDSLYNGIFGGSNFFNSIANKNFQTNMLNATTEISSGKKKSEEIKKELELLEKSMCLKKEIARLKGELELVENEIRDLRRNKD